MYRLLAALLTVTALSGCSTLAPSGVSTAGSAAATVPAPVSSWEKAIDGKRATAWVHAGVAIPPAVFAHMKESAENQMTVFMRSCSADGTSMLKVEHTRGRPGTSHAALVEATSLLAKQEDNAEAAQVLDYALVVGHATYSLEPTTTLRVFAPSVLSPQDQTPEVVVDADQLYRAFPALAEPCPGIGDASSVAALSLRSVVEARMPRDETGRAVRDFGANGGKAAAAFNEMSAVMAAIRQPSQVLGARFYENGQLRVAQASKWELTGAESLMLVLEAKDGKWQLRAQ